MARAHLREQLVSDKTGALTPISGATVNVYEQGTTTQVAATMYDAASGGNVLTNPLTSDANGVVQFWMASPQLVDLAISASGFTSQTIEGEVLGVVSGTTGVTNLTTSVAPVSAGDVEVSGENFEWKGTATLHTAVSLDQNQVITGAKTLTPVIAAGAPTAAGNMGYTSSHINWGDGSASHTVASLDQAQTFTGNLTGPFLDKGGAVYNVKAAGYGAAGDGTTDDTTAIQNAINAANVAGGGIVFFPPGTYISTLLTLHSKVHLIGAGITATVLKLKNTTNTSFLQTNSFATLTGGNTTGGEFNFSIQNLTVDGNRANQTGDATKAAIQIYGYGYILHNLRVHDSLGVGIYSEWSTSAADPGNDAMEAHCSNIKVHHCYSHGVQFRGPHDSMFVNLTTCENGQGGTGGGIKVESAGTYAADGTQWSNVHSWGTTQDWGLSCASPSQLFTNFQFEGGTSGGVLVFANNCNLVGGQCFSTATGIQIDNASTHTRFIGHIESCTATAIKFNSDGGYSYIDADVYLTSNGATSYTGTIGVGSKINIRAGASTATPKPADLCIDAEDFTTLTPAATVSLDASTGSRFSLTPNQATTINATGISKGEKVMLEIVTSGISSFVLTFGTNFKTTGTLTTGTVSGKTFVMQFECLDGTNLLEISRTAAM